MTRNEFDASQLIDVAKTSATDNIMVKVTLYRTLDITKFTFGTVDGIAGKREADAQLQPKGYL